MTVTGESLSKDVFERRMSTGSEGFSLFICLDANKFVLLSFFSLIKTIYPRVSTKPLPNDANSPLPFDVRRSKTLLLKLPNDLQGRPLVRSSILFVRIFIVIVVKLIVKFITKRHRCHYHCLCRYWFSHLLRNSSYSRLSRTATFFCPQGNRCGVADLGKGLGRPALPALFLDQTEAQRAEKFFGETAPPPPYLRVWMNARPQPPSLLSERLDPPLLWTGSTVDHWELRSGVNRLGSLCGRATIKLSSSSYLTSSFTYLVPGKTLSKASIIFQYGNFHSMNKVFNSYLQILTFNFCLRLK